MKLIDDKKYYKMSELVELTGLNNHTIQFYSKKELLPHTLSTSKNMKYYPEITVTVLNLIKYLKEHLGFSIDYIKELFDYYRVDFSNKGDLILQSIQMISFEITDCSSKTDLEILNLQQAIDLGILQKKENYFKTEIEVLKVFNELLRFDVSLELIEEYIRTSKLLANLERKLADRVLEKEGELPEVLVLDILNKFKPFVFNSSTIEAFKE